MPRTTNDLIKDQIIIYWCLRDIEDCLNIIKSFDKTKDIFDFKRLILSIGFINRKLLSIHFGLHSNQLEQISYSPAFPAMISKSFAKRIVEYIKPILNESQLIFLKKK